MKVTGQVGEKINDGKSIEVQVMFLSDDETRTLHSFTVIVDEPNKYLDYSSIVKFGAYPKLRDDLAELIPQIEGILADAIKTDAQREAEATNKIHG